MLACKWLEVHHESAISADRIYAASIECVDRRNKGRLHFWRQAPLLAHSKRESWHFHVLHMVAERRSVVNLAGAGWIIVVQSKDAEHASAPAVLEQLRFRSSKAHAHIL